MYSAECGLDDVAWWLLKCRADPNAEDQRGETALVKACNRQPSAQQDVLLIYQFSYITIYIIFMPTSRTCYFYPLNAMSIASA